MLLLGFTDSFCRYSKGHKSSQTIWFAGCFYRYNRERNLQILERETAAEFWTERECRFLERESVADSRERNCCRILERESADF